jgi:predicted Fe-S protein YdhL (DUF1289 family)
MHNEGTSAGSGSGLKITHLSHYSMDIYISKVAITRHVRGKWCAGCMRQSYETNFYAILTILQSHNIFILCFKVKMTISALIFAQESSYESQRPYREECTITET